MVEGANTGDNAYTWRDLVVTNPHASCLFPNQAFANIVGQHKLAKALSSS